MFDDIYLLIPTSSDTEVITVSSSVESDGSLGSEISNMQCEDNKKASCATNVFDTTAVLTIPYILYRIHAG